MIRQAELARLMILRDQDAELRRLRRQVVEQISHGDGVEPGTYMAWLDREERRLFNRNTLVPVLGTDAVERLYRSITPTQCTILRVQPAEIQTRRPANADAGASPSWDDEFCDS